MWQLGPDIAPAVSACLSRPCIGMLAIVGTCTHHSYSTLYYLCHLASLLKLLPPPTPPLCSSHPPLIYAGPILMKKIVKTSKTKPLATYLPG